MQVIEGSLDDLDAVVALWIRCDLARPFSDPREDFRRCIGTPDAAVLIGRANSAVVATVMVGFDGHRAWVYFLASEPTLRRQGFARTMMNAAEQWARDRGAPRLNLMVREENAAAVSLYERLGMARQPVLLMGKSLD
ncbi:GNAT family acetyltransferase [Phenylobacterium sp.]|uniref:GNAT family acetyltransferase n=1 Tax=Phenylobacterium sp. TaxID=1871053 RepID=UPI00286E4F83|nr:GNAT family acetyltransferase [Phenylobacterium sp.]